jgi:hypothetical protein
MGAVAVVVYTQLELVRAQAEQVAAVQADLLALLQTVQLIQVVAVAAQVTPALEVPAVAVS